MEDEASLSHGTYNSKDNQFFEMKKNELKLIKKEHRKERIKIEECIICYEPLIRNYENIFWKTPCKHKFHRECLTDWMLILDKIKN